MIIKWMSDNACTTLSTFANWVDGTSELKAAILKHTTMKDSVLQLARLRMAWREADAAITRGVKRTAEGLEDYAKGGKGQGGYKDKGKGKVEYEFQGKGKDEEFKGKGKVEYEFKGKGKDEDAKGKGKDNLYVRTYVVSSGCYEITCQSM